MYALVVQRPLNTPKNHGTGLLFAAPGYEAAGATELPQESRAIEEDARNNRLTTILNRTRPHPAEDDEVKMREYGKYDEQDAEYANLGNYEDFTIDGETAELLRNIASKSGGVQISLKMYTTSKYLIEVLLETTEKIDDSKKLDEQICRVREFQVPKASRLQNSRVK